MWEHRPRSTRPRTSVPRTGLGITMQDIAADADDTLYHGQPLGTGNGAGGAEYVDCPGFVPAARGGDRGVTAGRAEGGAVSFGSCSSMG
jgi:hypothetical protein